MFAAAFRQLPDAKELQAALESLHLEDRGEPAFADVRDRIYRRRAAASAAKGHTEAHGQRCPECGDTGHVRVLTTPKHGSGSRMLDPARPEPLPAQRIYLTPQPCSCASGRAVNTEAVSCPMGGDLKQSKVYLYSPEKLSRIFALRVTTEQGRVYACQCDSMYREDHGLATEPPAKIKAATPELNAMIARILARAQSGAVEAVDDGAIDDATADAVAGGF